MRGQFVSICYQAQGISTVSISTPDAQLNCTGPCPVITATIGNILPGHDTYKWFNNTVLIPGAISSTFTACFPGSYTVNVTNSTSGCEANSSPFVIKPTPSVSCDLTADTIVCENKTDFVVVPNQAGVIYLWTVTGDGEAVSGVNTYRLTWKSKLNLTGSVHIAVTVTNTSTGCYCSNATTIKVQSEPTAYGGPDHTICASETVSLVGIAGNYSIASWVITSGPGTLQPSGNSKLATFVPDINPLIVVSNSTLAFNATAKPPCSGKVSDYVNITVYQKPIVTIEVISPK